MFDISNYDFFLEMLVASFIVSSSFHKRDNFYIRFFMSVLSIGVLLTFVGDRTIKFAIVTAAICAMQYFCWKILWKNAIYHTLCAYAMQHLTYCVGSAIVCAKSVFFHMPVKPEEMKPGTGLKPWLLHFVIYAACYFLFFRKKRKDDIEVPTSQVIFFACAVLAAVMVLSGRLQRKFPAEEYDMFLICYGYDILCCIVIICLDGGFYRAAVAQNNLDIIQYLWKKRQNQYVIAENNIRAINIKCHELKQQITKIQESGLTQNLSEKLENLKNSIGIYDAVVKTGNEVLDVVLTEKSLYCQAEKVVMSCIADGKSMDFMDAMDIYFIFETLLDDAVEKVCHIGEVQKRQIAISVWIQCGLLMIQIENYCEDKEKEENQAKKEYERKSVEYAVKKYKGTLTRHREGALFVQRISIPLP